MLASESSRVQSTTKVSGADEHCASAERMYSVMNTKIAILPIALIALIGLILLGAISILQTWAVSATEAIWCATFFVFLLAYSLSMNWVREHAKYGGKFVRLLEQVRRAMAFEDPGQLSR